MRKVYLLDNHIEMKNVPYIDVEKSNIYLDSKVNLRLEKKSDKYKIFRREKISFLEDNETEMNITKAEYDHLSEKFDIKNDGIIKKEYMLENKCINIYEGKFSGLITEVIENEDYVTINDDRNLIDITESDLASDIKLVNLTEEEFMQELANIKLSNNVY